MIEDICERFDIGEMASVRDAGGTRNKTFFVETDLGQWVVRRRYEDYCDPERLAFDHGALTHLAAAGVPVVPPRADIDGGTFWRNDAGLWEVYALVEGKHLREGEPDDLRALAASLARFHSAGRSYDARCDKLGPRGETDPEHLLRTAHRIRQEDAGVSDVLDPYEKAVRRAGEALPHEAWESLPHTLVHGDVQPANVLMGDGVVSAFLDLDWCAWRPRIYDLCFAILCCCARHEEPIGSGDVWALTQEPVLNASIADEFLRRYEGESEPFTDEERAALPSQTTLTWCHIRLDNALKVAPADRRRFLTRGGGVALSLMGG